MSDAMELDSHNGGSVDIAFKLFDADSKQTLCTTRLAKLCIQNDFLFVKEELMLI